MSFIGAVVGFLLGIALYVITAAFLGTSVFIFGTISTLITTAIISPLLAAMTAAAWLAVALFSIGVIYTFAYVIATIGVLPGLAD